MVNDSEDKICKKDVINMALLAYPCKSPMTIKEGHYESFMEKCKKSAITPERKKEYLEYSKLFKHESEDKQNG